MNNRIRPKELKHLIDAGDRLQLIDVRSAREYHEGHVPGAINIPLEEVESRLEDLRPAEPAILICQSGRRAAMCHDILARHRDELVVLEGGTKGWIDSGLDVVRSTANRLPLMRQVQIGAGSLVLTGTLLAYLVNINWIFLAMFVGAGLLTAGLTGFCGMAIMLEKLPWNRAKQVNANCTTQTC